MKLTAALILLSSVAFGVALVAFGLALSLAGTGTAAPLYVVGAIALVLAVAGVVVVRARNRRDGTSYTLFTI